MCLKESEFQDLSQNSVEKSLTYVKKTKKTVLIQNFKIKVKFQLEKNLNSEIIVNYAKAIKIEFCE